MTGVGGRIFRHFWQTHVKIIGIDHHIHKQVSVSYS